MKRLMLMLIMLVTAISTYSQGLSISEWWEGLSKEQRIEVLQDYIRIINAGENEIDFQEISFEVEIIGQDIILKPVYPDEQTGYILSIDGILEYEIELNDIVINDVVPKNNFWSISIPSFLLGALSVSLIWAFSN